MWNPMCEPRATGHLREPSPAKTKASPWRCSAMPGSCRCLGAIHSKHDGELCNTIPYHVEFELITPHHDMVCCYCCTDDVPCSA